MTVFLLFGESSYSFLVGLGVKDKINLFLKFTTCFSKNSLYFNAKFTQSSFNFFKFMFYFYFVHFLLSGGGGGGGQDVIREKVVLNFSTCFGKNSHCFKPKVYVVFIYFFSIPSSCALLPPLPRLPSPQHIYASTHLQLS